MVSWKLWNLIFTHIQILMHHLLDTLRLSKLHFVMEKTQWVDGQDKKFFALLNFNYLDYKQAMFKLTMKFNVTTCMVSSFDINPLTIMWHLVTTSQIIIFNFSKDVKLVELLKIGWQFNQFCIYANKLPFVKIMNFYVVWCHWVSCGVTWCLNGFMCMFL